MKDLLLNAATAIREAAHSNRAQRGAPRGHDSPGGDAQFDIDLIAEQALWRYLERVRTPLAVYTEDGALRTIGDTEPEAFLIVDPIDGTRSAAAGLESSMISLAVTRTNENPRLRDITDALLMELSTGRWMYAHGDSFEAHGYPYTVPAPTTVTELDRMFWSIEFNGHPMHLMNDAYSHLVDTSSNTGGIFIFNSSTYSISRIITGQLDAYVDIGNRILRDRPETRTDFEHAGRGNILHLFPYDIAAAVPIAQAAGIIITDAYGNSFDDMSLTDISAENQRSCIAASTPELHEQLLNAIRW